MLHFRGGRAGISKEHYPDLEPFYQDVADAYGDELRSLAAAGCTYVQMDDTNLAYLCDPKMREAARQRGDDPDELPHRYASFINRVVAQKPAGMTLCTHLCRGNFKSTWAAEGGYEPVAEALLTEMKRRRLLPRIRRRAQRGFPAAALPARRARPSCWASSPPKLGAMESKDDAEAPHRRGRPLCAAGAARAVAAVRLLQHRPRQRHRDGGAGGQAPAHRRGGAPEVWGEG